MSESPIAFAGGQIDRSDHLRSDPRGLAGLMNWRARLLRLEGLEPVIEPDGFLSWSSLADAEPDAELVFLGRDGERGCFAQVPSSLPAASPAANARGRAAMSTLDAAELAVYGTARSLVDWHLRHVGSPGTELEFAL